MGKWIGIGTLFQVAMVVVGHWVVTIANLFGPLGMLISMLIGLLWARESSGGYGPCAGGGAMVGGACALIGIAVSFLMGDVTASILVLGTVSSAAAGAIGGLVGHKVRPV